MDFVAKNQILLMIITKMKMSWYNSGNMTFQCCRHKGKPKKKKVICVEKCHSQFV